MLDVCYFDEMKRTKLIQIIHILHILQLCSPHPISAAIHDSPSVNIKRDDVCNVEMDRSKVHNPAVQLLKVSLQSQIKTNTQKVLTLTSTSARQFNIGIGSFLSLFYQDQLQNQKIPVSRLAARMLLCRQECRLQTYGAQYKHVTAEAPWFAVCNISRYVQNIFHQPEHSMLRIFAANQILN